MNHLRILENYERNLRTWDKNSIHPPMFWRWMKMGTCTFRLFFQFWSPPSFSSITPSFLSQCQPVAKPAKCFCSVYALFYPVVLADDGCKQLNSNFLSCMLPGLRLNGWKHCKAKGPFNFQLDYCCLLMKYLIWFSIDMYDVVKHKSMHSCLNIVLCILSSLFWISSFCPLKFDFDIHLS